VKINEVVRKPASALHCLKTFPLPSTQSVEWLSLPEDIVVLRLVDSTAGVVITFGIYLVVKTAYSLTVLLEQRLAGPGYWVPLADCTAFDLTLLSCGLWDY
jgi:hypothetical protein